MVHQPTQEPNPSKSRVAATLSLNLTTIMASSRFASQYKRIRDLHAKIKLAKSDIHSLIDSCISTKSIAEHETMTSVLRKALNHLDVSIMDYSTAVSRLRRKVEHMISDTEERKEAKEAEENLFHDMRDGEDDDLDFNETFLSDILLPSMRSLIDRALQNAKTDLNIMMEMIAKKESIHALNSINQSIESPTGTNLTLLNDDQSTRSGEFDGNESQLLTAVLSRFLEKPNLAPLPPIALTPFNGESTHWEPFFSQYTSIIDSKSHLSNDEKLCYLRNALTGAAFKTIEGIPVGGKYLQATIDRLTTVYGRGKRSNAILVNQLLWIRPKSHSFEDQLECTQELMNIVIQLEDKSIVDNFTLIHQIAGSIHSKHIKMMYKREPSTMMEALDLIDSDLRERIEIQKLTSTFCPTNRHDSHLQSNQKQREQNPVIQTNAKPSLANQSHDGLSCVYCGMHKFSMYPTVSSISERRNILIENKLCFKCLSSKHMAINCDRNCHKCGKTHHESICDPGIPHSVITASVAYNTPVNPSH